MEQKIVILNGNGLFLNFVPIKKAIRYIMKDIVVPFCKESIRVCLADNKFIEVPKILQLKHVIRKIYKGHIPLTRRNIFIRDGYQCQYCSIHESNMTIDHVVPVSRGGKNVWENLVCCCKKCNWYKNNKLPVEANMFLKSRPYQPTVYEFIMKKMESFGVNEIIKSIKE